MLDLGSCSILGILHRSATDYTTWMHSVQLLPKSLPSRDTKLAILVERYGCSVTAKSRHGRQKVILCHDNNVCVFMLQNL